MTRGSPPKCQPRDAARRAAEAELLVLSEQGLRVRGVPSKTIKTKRTATICLSCSQKLESIPARSGSEGDRRGM